VLKILHASVIVTKKLVIFNLLRLSFSSTPSNADSEHPSTSLENDWEEKSLGPFDLHRLHLSFNHFTPYKLRKLLEPPLDIPASLHLFNWASTQRGYSDSYYLTFFRKLASAREFSTVVDLLLRSKEEGIVLKKPLFIFLMRCYGKSGTLDGAAKVLDECLTYLGVNPPFCHTL
jgi:hypothetical protein